MRRRDAVKASSVPCLWHGMRLSSIPPVRSPAKGKTSPRSLWRGARPCTPFPTAGSRAATSGGSGEGSHAGGDPLVCERTLQIFRPRAYGRRIPLRRCGGVCAFRREGVRQIQGGRPAARMPRPAHEGRDRRRRPLRAEVAAQCEIQPRRQRGARHVARQGDRPGGESHRPLSCGGRHRRPVP